MTNGKLKWQAYDKPSTTSRKPRRGVTESFLRPDNARIGSGRKSLSSPYGRTPSNEQLMPKQLPLPDIEIRTPWRRSVAW